MVQVLSINSTYKNILIKDKVINKGTWRIPVEVSETSFLRRGITQPKTQPQLVILCYIDRWDIPWSELQWCSWLSER